MSMNPTVAKETTTLSEDMDKATTTFDEAMNIEPTATALTFDEAMNIEPTATAVAAAGQFYRVSLSQNGTHLGWLGQDSKQWAKLVSQAEALTLEWYPYNGVNYYRIRGTNRYMSVSDRAYVGFYSWSGATGFTVVGSHLRSDYNHQEMSYDKKEKGYLTCWNTYARLDVGFQRV
ncbi:hypothetical protein [Microseira wollei]|uniref:Uncharacterized protein n=1 Tax=Microseira wollei NIES-4236 TaxID=2530354 RepID=A0AAV3X3Z5_9CYAN|nr:hypothetical protein [Microseira wollei]GET35310.1 hypothetical protein MiSe_00520 [Microseira wollei NIES-4236]